MDTTSIALFFAGLVISFVVNYVLQIRRVDSLKKDIEHLQIENENTKNSFSEIKKENLNVRLSQLEIQFTSIKDILLEIKEDLRELVDTAHKMGMYIVLDIVINHTGDNWAYGNDAKPEFSADGTRYPFGFWRTQNRPEAFGPDDAVWPAELQDPDCYTRRGAIAGWRSPRHSPARPARVSTPISSCGALRRSSPNGRRKPAGAPRRWSPTKGATPRRLRDRRCRGGSWP